MAAVLFRELWPSASLPGSSTDPSACGGRSFLPLAQAVWLPALALVQILDTDSQRTLPWALGLQLACGGRCRGIRPLGGFFRSLLCAQISCAPLHFGMNMINAPINPCILDQVSSLANPDYSKVCTKGASQARPRERCTVMGPSLLTPGQAIALYIKGIPKWPKQFG